MQYLEKLSDRAAAQNLRFRLDWKIAFGLEVDFKGIHPTTLVYFRDRLLENDKASLAFDKVLEHLKSCGLVKKGSKQRIDSTHVIGNVRELSRLELFHETLRLFCEDVADLKSLMNSAIADKIDYYLEDISIRGLSDLQRNKYISDAGLAMRVIIDWAKNTPDELKIREKSSFATLATVFQQNFIDTNPDPDGPPDLIKIATGKDHISSPHDPDARYASKGSETWLGFKVQVAETIGENDVGTGTNINFITHIEVQEATDHDSSAAKPYLEDQQARDIAPKEVYGDTHYNSSSNINHFSENEVELKGPVAPVPAKKANDKNQGFEALLDENRILCPEGHESKRFATWGGGRVAGTFAKDECLQCGHQGVCKPEKRGKRIVIRPESDLLKQRRALMETDDFKKDMHKRNGIEGTLSGIVRGQGLRRCRFRGLNKTKLQAKMSGAAANISRLHRMRQKIPTIIEKIAA